MQLSLHQNDDHQNDETQRRLPRPLPVAAPEYGAPQRGAIDSVIDHLVSDVLKHTGELKLRLDELEQEVLNSAAAAKATLAEQVEVSRRVREQCNQIAGVITEITDRVTDLS